MLPIRFSYQNALQENVGDHGLTREDFDDRAASEALHCFRARVDRGEVGFPTLPLDANGAKHIEKFAATLRPDIDTVLVLGIGGSALGASAIDTALRGPQPLQRLDKKSQRLFVMDNVDPAYCSAMLAQLNPKRVAVCVISKSGGTPETIATFLLVYDWLVQAVGAKKAQKRIIAVTDPAGGDLLQIAKDEKFTTFYIPGNVAGRFSVLTPVGLLPAALCGIDIQKLLRGAREANQYGWSRDLGENIALQSAMIHYLLYSRRQKKDRDRIRLFQFPVGCGLLVPPTVGRKLGQARRSSRTGRPHRSDIGHRPGRHGPALAASALHGRPPGQDAHVLDRAAARHRHRDSLRQKFREIRIRSLSAEKTTVRAVARRAARHRVGAHPCRPPELPLDVAEGR